MAVNPFLLLLILALLLLRVDNAEQGVVDLAVEVRALQLTIATRRRGMCLEPPKSAENSSLCRKAFLSPDGVRVESDIAEVGQAVELQSNPLIVQKTFINTECSKTFINTESLTWAGEWLSSRLGLSRVLRNAQGGLKTRRVNLGFEMHVRVLPEVSVPHNIIRIRIHLQVESIKQRDGGASAIVLDSGANLRQLVSRGRLGLDLRATVQ